jgi:hypothetical protein
MPRFSIGEEYSDPSYGRDIASFASPSQRSSSNSSSVRLVCLSPDGRSLHSFQGRYIETQSLPLEEHGYAGANTETPSLIRTTLPEWVQSALQIDPAVELLCVEGESLKRKSEMDTRQSLPRLCLYTSKSAFLLQLAYEPSESHAVTQGIVVSVSQPFERYLEFSYANKIIRIRPAPQRYTGFSTMCPGASMAALVLNTETQEYSMMLHHANGKVTIPLVFGVECLEDWAREQIVDFAFAQSTGLALLSSLSVVLLKGSGDLCSASPIVFDGAVVPSTLLHEALDYLGAMLEAHESSSVKWRQCRAAQHYLLDVFGGRPDQRTQFSTARIEALSHQPNSAVN